MDGAVEEEERSRLPQLNMSTPYWDLVVESEYAGRLHSWSDIGNFPVTACVESYDEEEAAHPSCASH